MAYDTFQTIQRFWQRFAREELEGLPAAERQRIASEMEGRFGSLMSEAAGDDNAAFADLVGFGSKGAVPFGEIAWPRLPADFDAAISPSQLHAVAELYFICQNEKAGVSRWDARRPAGRSSPCRRDGQGIPPAPRRRPVRREAGQPDRRKFPCAICRK